MLRRKWRTRFVSYVKRKLYQRKRKKEEETATDKAARRAATATAWMAFFTLVLVVVGIGTYLILKNQLREMHEGGVDTHDLALAAKAANETTLRLFRESDKAILVADPPMEVLERRTVKVRVRNIGKRQTGPFFLWIVASRWRNDEPKPIMSQNEQFTAHPDARRIPPNGYLDFLVRLSDAKDTDIERIKAGTERLMVNVTVGYDDGFTERQDAQASFEYNPGVGWSSNIPVYTIKGEEKLPEPTKQK